MEIKAGYKTTEVGVIPEDWDVKTIDEVFDICNNLRLPISEDIRKTMQGIYPYYGPTKIQDYLNEYRVEGEYALIGEDGDHFLKWNDISMTQITLGKFNVNNHAHIIKGKSNITLTKWFYYFYKNRDITQHLTRQGAGRYKLSKSTLVKIPCAIPPTLTEQTAIANALSDADALITSLEKLIVKKRNIKQGAMQKLLQPKEGWEVKRLGELSDFSSGIAHENFINDNGEFVVVNSKFISTNGEVKKYVNKLFCPAEIEDILIVLSDVPNGKAIAKCFFVNCKDLYTVNQRIGIIKPKNIDSKYLYYLINRHPDLLSFDDGVKQTNLRNQDVLNLPLTIHKSLSKQVDIARYLTDMDNEITALENKLEKYKKIKLGMMQNLLTGRIRLI
ncbi:MAG: restriction endonuclease subunit S [Desulfamplus sp.]|nr:restriction endonuclease subunit S [Desulfamplus sp.]